MDLVLLAWAAEPEDRRFAGLLEAAEGWPEPDFPLKGRDLLAMGAPPGPQVGRLLGEIERWWIDADFRPGREDCLQELRRRAARDWDEAGG